MLQKLSLDASFWRKWTTLYIIFDSFLNTDKVRTDNLFYYASLFVPTKLSIKTERIQQHTVYKL